MTLHLAILIWLHRSLQLILVNLCVTFLASFSRLLTTVNRTSFRKSQFLAGQSMNSSRATFVPTSIFAGFDCATVVIRLHLVDGGWIQFELSSHQLTL